MLSLNSCGYCRVSTARAFQFQFQTSSLPSPSLFFSNGKNYRFRSSIARAGSGFADDSDSNEEPKSNYAGVQLEDIVDCGFKSGKLRLDSWISSRINGISRARVQSSIKAGLVHVNDRVVDKVNSIVIPWIGLKFNFVFMLYVGAIDCIAVTRSNSIPKFRFPKFYVLYILTVDFLDVVLHEYLSFFFNMDVIMVIILHVLCWSSFTREVFDRSSFREFYINLPEYVSMRE